VTGFVVELVDEPMDTLGSPPARYGADRKAEGKRGLQVPIMGGPGMVIGVEAVAAWCLLLLLRKDVMISPLGKVPG
jgi:hypothetical protein